MHPASPQVAECAEKLRLGIPLACALPPKQSQFPPKPPKCPDVPMKVVLTSQKDVFSFHLA
jgi:hypothetical protein